MEFANQLLLTGIMLGGAIILLLVTIYYVIRYNRS